VEGLASLKSGGLGTEKAKRLEGVAIIYDESVFSLYPFLHAAFLNAYEIT